jgi:hypothetical protein
MRVRDEEGNLEKAQKHADTGRGVDAVAMSLAAAATAAAAAGGTRGAAPLRGRQD